jgi:hypothetical protein
MEVEAVTHGIAHKLQGNLCFLLVFIARQSAQIVALDS